MITLENLTPRIFYKQSRDFQFIGRLFDLVLNSVKTNSDTIYYLPFGINHDDQLVDLLATSLGFKLTHNYNAKQLGALCSVLPKVLKNKGSIEAITIAANAMLQAEGIVDNIDYSIKNGKLTLYIPEQLSDLTLLSDLLTYVLPAGMSCALVKELKETVPVRTEIGVSDYVTIYRTMDAEGNYVYTNMSNSYIGSRASLADLFDESLVKPMTEITEIGSNTKLTRDQIKDFAGPFVNSELFVSLQGVVSPEILKPKEENNGSN